MRSDFENSVEFDLFQCDYGKSLMERYQMLDLLYESDRSSVYKMMRYSDESIFSLKALKNEAGIVYDISRISHLSHEGMSKIVEFGESEKYKFVVKPYVEGFTLLEYVRLRGPLEEKEVKDIARQIIDVFEYFHSQSEPIIYRDLKPANVIIGSDGKIVLIDVETMRMVGRNRGSDTFYVGTHGYASPEQYGFRQSDIRSDIYSFGATLYFLLTGSEPIVESIKYKQITEINPKISSQMAYVVSKCMQFNPDERFNNVLGIKRAMTSRANFGKFGSKKLKLGLVMMAFIVVLAISVNYLVEAITANIMGALSKEQEQLITQELPIEPVSEPISESHALTEPPVSRGYDSEGEVDLSQITELTSGIGINVNGEHPNYKILVDRTVLPSEAKDFEFISVFSVDGVLSDSNLQNMIFSGEEYGHGLQYYDEDLGFLSHFIGDGYLVILYDAEYYCVGYQYFHKTEFIVNE